MKNSRPYEEFLVEQLREDRGFAILFLKDALFDETEDKAVRSNMLHNLVQAYGDLNKIGQEAGISQEALDEALTALHDERGHEVMLAEAA